MVANAVNFAAMAKKADDKTQLGIRYDNDLVKALREFANAHPMKPSLTTILHQAGWEWLKNHAGELPRKPK